MFLRPKGDASYDYSVRTSETNDRRKYPVTRLLEVGVARSVRAFPLLAFRREQLMHPSDYAKLIEDVEHELLIGSQSIGILGLTRVTLQILNSLLPLGVVSTVKAVYAHEAITSLPNLPGPLRPLRDYTN